MTHPTKETVIPALAEAIGAIDDNEMTRMCLTVNQMFGNDQAKKLMNLILAARQHVKG